MFGGLILKRGLAIIFVAVTLATIISGCNKELVSTPVTNANTQQGTNSANKIPNDPTFDTTPELGEGWIPDSQLYCEKVGIYSGRFVEDSSDRKIENVAAMLISNRSDRHLDIAMLTCEINGKTAQFNVAGLPAGKSAWVLESGAMQIASDPEVVFVDSVIAYRDEAISQTEELEIVPQGNTLRAVNKSNHTMYNVYVYYKVLHTDGNYLGGITYGVGFGDLEPGQTGDSLAAHYQEGKTEIIRVAWLDAPLT